MMVFMCFLLFLISVFMIISQSGHFFMVLLSFEVMTLVLFLVCCCSFFYSGGYALGMFSVGFLVFSVCEASLGLSLLVSSMRDSGFDYIKSSISLNF